MQHGEPEEDNGRNQQRSKNSYVAEEDCRNGHDRQQERKLEESEPQVLFAIGCLSLVQMPESGRVFGFGRCRFGVGRVWDDRLLAIRC